MTSIDTTSQLLDTLQSATDLKPLPDGRHVVVAPSEGRVHVFEALPDAHLPTPKRQHGVIRPADVDSFVAAWKKYARAFSEAYADPDRFTLTAVFDADSGFAQPGHRDFRAVLQLQHTPQWKAWSHISGSLLSQADFADFLEDRAVDVEFPTSAEILELAKTFEANTEVNFKSVERTSSSTRSLVFEETASARAGEAGQIEIPNTLTLVLQPFVGGPAFRVTARFRYRVRSGGLQLGVTLVRAEDVLGEAFQASVEQFSSEAAFDGPEGPVSPLLLFGSAPAPLL